MAAQFSAGLTMGLFLGAVVLVFLGGDPGLAAPAMGAEMLPRDAARLAVDSYNQETGTQSVFRLLKLKSTHKTRFIWGLHFSMNFTIKETYCQKTASYRIGDCRYVPSGLVRDCSADMSVLDFMEDTPLISVKCIAVQRTNKKPNPNARPQAAPNSPRVTVKYFPSSFSTAAQMAIEEE